MLFANSNFKELLLEGALFNSEIEIQCVGEHVWVGGNPGRFGPGSFRPESFRPGSFRPILGVVRFGLGRWVVSANFIGESIRP